MGCLKGVVLGFPDDGSVGRLESVALGFADDSEVGFALTEIADGLAVDLLLGEYVCGRGLREGALVTVCVKGFRVSAAVGLLEGPEGR